MAEAQLTPMMAQYRRIKGELPKCLLLFRLGDFYEMFFEDAQNGAQLLNLALTRATAFRCAACLSTRPTIISPACSKPDARSPSAIR